MLPAASQLNVDQIAELAHSLHAAASTTMGIECLMADIPMKSAIGLLHGLNMLTQPQPFAVWLSNLPALDDNAARQSVSLCNGMLKAAVCALGPSLGGSAIGRGPLLSRLAGSAPSGLLGGRPLPYSLRGPTDCAQLLSVVQKLCTWPGAQQQQLQDVWELLHMAIRACRRALDGRQLPPSIGSACMGSLVSLPAAASLSTAAVLALLQEAHNSGAVCCAEQLGQLRAAANMREELTAALIEQATWLNEANMVAKLCARLPCRALAPQSVAKLATAILVQFSTDNGRIPDICAQPTPCMVGVGGTTALDRRAHEAPPSIHDIPSAAAALEVLLSLPAAQHVTASELAGMLHAAVAGWWGYKVLLQLLGAVPPSQPSPVMLATLSQVTEQQATEVLSAAAGWC